MLIRNLLLHPEVKHMPTIATWNVNSIKARHERLMSWLAAESPDIVCLQELKVTEEVFPFDDLRAIGYHSAVSAQKTWNGVAILSKEPITNVVAGMQDDVDDPQARAISASTFGIDVVGVYVPNGKTVGSDKWEYKIRWMRRLRDSIARRFSPTDELVLCGDVNIAPTEDDVAFPEKWAASVLCDPAGRKALSEIMDFGFTDVVRKHNEGPGPLTWWDYRMLAFPKGDGLRIDHILATEALANRSTDAWVARDERKGVKPSDHAPVLASFR
jgi:exodeoxyribonuclease-3